ncbi:MAG: PQQ-binding-like beta-propeller repeat protein [Verrucomicrobiae bacterium]|nr:PQQ-binding-like beta-propeller repeat protein [Verrucomicrobiae bacterium]
MIAHSLLTFCNLPTVKTLTLFLAALAFASTANADWLQFRGPQGNGYIDGNQNLPIELSENTIAWKVALPGRGIGSPLIVGDRVYLTAASGPEQKQLHVLCFSAVDGKPLWQRNFWATGRTMCHNKTCVAAPTPASDGERIYALWSSNDLICLDLDGNLIWTRGLTLDYPNASNSLGMASSPIVADGTLVAQIENDSESFAAGFDLLTGANRWKIDRPKAANWTSPVPMKSGEQVVVALQSSKGILGVLPATGSEIFNYAKGASTIPSSAADGDTLFVPSNGLTAINPGESGGDPTELWNESAQRPGTASPLIIGDTVYIINGAGVLSATSRKTGELAWKDEKGDPLKGVRLKGPFSGSPVASGNGHLYIFNEQGVGQCVNLSGDQGKIVSEIDLEETILGTPSISDDALYIRSDGHLWKFATKP